MLVILQLLWLLLVELLLVVLDLVAAVVVAAGQLATLLVASILLLEDVEFDEPDPYFLIWGGWDYLTGVFLVVLYLTSSPDLHHVLLSFGLGEGDVSRDQTKGSHQ